MAKTPAVADKPVEGAEPRISLTEFCLRLSSRVQRVELIGAFEHAERTSGKNRDTEAAFEARFNTFTKKPV